MEKALKWWNTLGNNPFERLILKGELATKYHSFDRIPSSLKEEEIKEIYEKEGKPFG